MSLDNVLANLDFEPRKGKHVMYLKDKFGLSADLCKLQNRHIFQGSSYQYSSSLIIDGNDVGDLHELNFDDLIKLAIISSVDDEKGGKSWEIKGSRIEFSFACPDLSTMAPMFYSIEAVLNKLCVYENKGCFVEENEINSENHIGKVVVYLPIKQQSCKLVVFDDHNELDISFDECSQNEYQRISWVAFYTDLKHKVETGESGRLVTLQFDLNIREDEKASLSKMPAPLSWERRMYEHKSSIRRPQSYHLQDYSEDVLETMKEKIRKILEPPKKLQLDEKIEPKLLNESKKRTNEESEYILQDNDKIEDEMSEAKTVDRFAFGGILGFGVDGLKDKQQLPEEIDCVCLMLKRRYGLLHLSGEMLKGNDAVLYHALRKDFRVEVMRVMFSQTVNRWGVAEDLVSIESIVELKPEENNYSSEEEIVMGKKKLVLKNKHDAMNFQAFMANSGKSEEPKPKVTCFVRGSSVINAIDIAPRRYVEKNGYGEFEYGEFKYMNAALFVYPR